MPARYTHGHTQGVLADHATRGVTDSAAFMVPHLDRTLRLLDLGCGPGSITRELAALVANVVGIDASSEAIETARASAPARSNLVFEVADVYELPFDDATFDVVYAHQLLQHLSDPVGALREARRVLRPGGVVAVRDADYGSMVHSPRSARLERWLQLYHEVVAHNGGEADAGRHLLGWVGEAGFLEPVVTSSTWTYATPDSVAGWRDLWVGRLVDGRLGADAIRLGLMDTSERDELVTAWKRWAASPAPFFAFLHGEVVARAPDGASAR